MKINFQYEVPYAKTEYYNWKFCKMTAPINTNNWNAVHYSNYDKIMELCENPPKIIEGSRQHVIVQNENQCLSLVQIQKTNKFQYHLTAYFRSQGSATNEQDDDLLRHIATCVAPNDAWIITVFVGNYHQTRFQYFAKIDGKKIN